MFFKFICQKYTGNNFNIINYNDYFLYDYKTFLFFEHKKSAANATLQLYYFVEINYFKAAKTSS